MKRVLIVEDDEDLRSELADFLGSSNYQVTAVGSVTEAENALVNEFDLLVLDINLPDGNGMELCRRIRPYLRAGIVMCTGRSEREIRIASLLDGADAYLVKPVDPYELDATLVSLLRRSSANRGTLLAPAPMPAQWRLDCIRQTLTGPGNQAVKLSPSECRLLSDVLRAPSHQVSRAALLSGLESAGIAMDGRRLETMISRLRGKVLEKMGVPLPLEPVYGRGYTFADHAEVI